MAAAAVTASMASLSLRGSSFQEFNGLVAQPSARPAPPSPAHGDAACSLPILRICGVFSSDSLAEV